jgi:hypothetical protein
MKLNKLKISLLFLCWIVFISCNSEENDKIILENNNDNLNVLNARTDEDANLFAEDPRLITLFNLCDAMVKMNSANQDEIQLIYIKNLVIQLENQYGKDNILNYLNEFNTQNRRAPVVLELVDFSGGGDKCHLDDDGTVNMDDCNFWEYLIVSLKAIGCPENPVEASYKCMQDVVCKTC